MTTKLARPRRLWWLAGALWLLPLGCGGPSARTADPAEAQQTLRAVLDAWKGGETPADLARRSPAIHVADLDWSDGCRLVSFQAEGKGRLVGFDMNYPVVLELKDPHGKTRTKTAVYVITTHPEVLVLRQEG